MVTFIIIALEMSSTIVPQLSVVGIVGLTYGGKTYPEALISIMSLQVNVLSTLEAFEEFLNSFFSLISSLLFPN